ncbi:RNA-binding protein [Runella sp. CRIBMP]|uniref:VCBS repeat-containing protein n=1 Tax=Runella sp. CRIBMP TaxID=2683261 RepID=UPI001412A47B|nr:VCBS repeat-containing protein [Runella sp. CRIBMP]NBB18016.1 RNA-binding protein [Runella sp. CRIBMP]
MMKKRSILPFPALLCASVLWQSCQQPADKNLFEAMPGSKTGINFANRIEDKKELNVFNYRNFYNGGGVAIGDVNNDGWADIFVTSNFEKNQLFLNKGKNKTDLWEFDDVTLPAGVGGAKAWSTGATFADVNGDGLMDIYVCNAGNIKGDLRGNELFINQGIGKDGVPKFIDKATEYGLVDGGYSTHAAFFDYDRDGDLDMYLLNNSFQPVNKLNYKNLRSVRDSLGGHKLFRNELISKQKPNGQKPHFTDVSEEAGIFGSLIAFGLGITIGDVNNDNWLDIYISNDFYERDYLYINQQNGTFKESLEESMEHISLSSMGADIADINNDGLLDIFVTDMLPRDDKRLKMNSVFESYELTAFKEKQDYWHQYMRNMLHLNQGTKVETNPQKSAVETPAFAEVGQLAGVHATDWSWGALIFDMDNDGQKDLFVANGIVRNLTDQDYVAFLSDRNNIQALIEGQLQFDYRKFVDMISSTPIPNFAFHNKGNLHFEDNAAKWGLGEANFSNGSAYGDLDNDGDLDLVVNNNNAALGVFRNHSVEKLRTHFLRVKLKGTQANPDGIGAKVYLYQKGKMQYLQQMPNRGFQSSSDLNLVFGLGNNPQIDSITVIWPDDKMQSFTDIKADTELQLKYTTAKKQWKIPYTTNRYSFEQITDKVKLDFVHEENNFVDYNRDGLLKQMYSTQGPALAVADFNGDGLDDVYVGGGSGKRRALFAQQTDGTFSEISKTSFGSPALADETAATFFDADGDKDLDLYVVTGGNEFLTGEAVLADKLYLNDGKGNFALSRGLPNVFENGSCVTAADYDRDGDVDLFVGTRMISGQYGLDPRSYLLQNDGKGNFKDVTKEIMPNNGLGMVTDASFEDLNKDGYPELIVVGDWMPIVILQNQKGKFPLALTQPIKYSNGWWNALEPADVDGDGDIDFIIGNLGRNSKLQCSEKEPAELYINDFDRNGSVEQIITCYNPDGKSYPMVLKPDLQKVLPVIKKRFIRHEDYGGKSIEDVFTKEQMEGVQKKVVYQANSSLLINNGKGEFTLQALPLAAQFSPIFGIVVTDYDKDKKLDILLTGNFFDVLSEIGRYDANDGLILRGLGNNTNGQPEFEVVKASQSGFSVKGQVRKMHKVRSVKGKELLILAKNKDKVQVLGLNQ